MPSFRQPSSTFNDYDPGNPRSEPDLSTPARLTAVQIEDEIRRDLVETGAFIAADGRVMLRRSGLLNRVSFLPDELAGVPGATFTHNHPGGGSFSLEDILVAAELGLQEIRVVTPRFRHGAAGLPNLQREAWRTAYDLQQTRLMALLASKVKLDALHPFDFGFEVRHRVWVHLSRQFGFIYWRENS